MSGVIPPVIPPGLRQGLTPPVMQGPLQQGMNPPQQGLLAPSTQSYGAPPLPNLEGLVQPMRPVGERPTDHQVIATLLPKRNDHDIPDDPTDDLPPEIRPYAAGLRPTVQPPSSEWVQEIIYQRLGKEDHEIAEINRYYFGIARNYDEELSNQRVTASEYYNGKGFGDEPALKGRSQLVMTVVRDTIRSTLPSLLRVFTGVEDPVHFEPISNEISGNDKLATMLSRQATDYARWALFVANKGWVILHDALLDALTRKAGWVRWSWGKRAQVRTEVAEGLLLPQLQMMLAEPGIEAQRIVRRPMTMGEQQALQKVPEGQMYMQQGGAPEYWSATITRSVQQAWPVVESVPAECVWVVSDAATVNEARGVFHVRDVSVSSLIEMGLDPHAVLTAAGTGSMRAQGRREAIARDSASGHHMHGGPPSDRAMGMVRYIEGWIRCDADNDNKAELLHTHSLGDDCQLIQWERTDEIPLSCFTPYREPGRIIGSSVSDMVMDLQRLQSRVMRATLDSLGQAMYPRTVITLGQVNMSDVRQTAIGSIIRVAQQGAVQELVKPFAGQAALPIMQLLEGVRESRTGITRASQGLTVDELQSTAPIAVSQQTSAAQDRLDMMARTLAETGLAPLYSGLLRMLARQQDRPNVIRIRGEWVSIDPRALGTMWEAAVEVGGKGMPMERLAMLSQIAGKQEQILATQGLNNPLVGVPEYRNTLARMLETANIADVSNYFKALPPGWQPPAPQQGPTAEQLLAMVQQQKTAADLETDRAKAQTDRSKALSDDDRERDKAALDAWVALYKIGAQFGTPVPSLDEMRAAMQPDAPSLGLIGDLPPPTSPQQPATGVQGPQQQPKPGGSPMTGMAPGGVGGLGAQRPQAPMAPPVGSTPPDTAQAVRRALAGQGLPTAYGQIADRAVAGQVAGMGGPSLPNPGGLGG
jgi:hypothetical protein